MTHPMRKKSSSQKSHCHPRFLLTRAIAMVVLTTVHLPKKASSIYNRGCSLISSVTTVDSCGTIVTVPMTATGDWDASSICSMTRSCTRSCETHVAISTISSRCCDAFSNYSTVRFCTFIQDQPVHLDDLFQRLKRWRIESPPKRVHTVLTHRRSVQAPRCAPRRNFPVNCVSTDRCCTRSCEIYFTNSTDVSADSSDTRDPNSRFHGFLITSRASFATCDTSRPRRAPEGWSRSPLNDVLVIQIYESVSHRIRLNNGFRHIRFSPTAVLVHAGLRTRRLPPRTPPLVWFHWFLFPEDIGSISCIETQLIIRFNVLPNTSVRFVLLIL